MATAKEIRSLFRKRRAPIEAQLPDDGPACAVRLLSDAEIDRAREQAMQWLDARCKSERLDVARLMLVDPDLYEREKTRRIVHAAFCEPCSPDEDEPKPLFPSIDTIRELDAAYISELMTIYLDLQDMRTSRRALTDGELTTVLAALESDDGEAVLATLDETGLRRLIRELAQRLRGSP